MAVGGSEGGRLLEMGAEERPHCPIIMMMMRKSEQCREEMVEVEG